MIKSTSIESYVTGEVEESSDHDESIVNARLTNDSKSRV
jgi:hypothetical protein